MDKLKYLLARHGLHCCFFIVATIVTNHSVALTPPQCPQMCDWFSTLFPLCNEQDNSWGYENNQSCVGRLACAVPWNTGGVVEQCDNQNDVALCASMVGRNYFSDALFSVGLTPDSLYYNHRRVAFEEDILWATWFDIIFEDGYRCENNQVLATQQNGDTVLEFSNQFEQLSYAPDSNYSPVNYTLSTAQSENCGTLANARYQVDPSQLAAVSVPAGTSYFVEFGSENQAQMQLPEGSYPYVHPDCDTGVLHLHRDTGDSSPITGTIENEGAAIVLQLDANTTWRFLRDDTQMCTTEYDPVCSVELQNIVCVTEPCPIGVYKTYSNQCVSDAAGALFIGQGECGEREGEPYYENTCTAEYDPVCTAMVNPEPCLTSPCPIQEYKTFTNRCISRLAGARLIRLGECGDDEGQRIFDLSEDGGVCGAIYQPVCGKDESGIVCVTEPCPTHEYVTFGNACEASILVADIAWPHQACGDLAGITSSSAPPVEMVETAPINAAQVTSAEIRDDELFVSLRYTGCETSHFDLLVERSFAENNEVLWAFQPVITIDKSCFAYQDVDLRFDLLPLQVLYEQSHGDGPATIVLPGLADYEINQGTVEPPSLEVSLPEIGTVGSSITLQVTAQFYGEDAPGYPTVSVQNPNGNTIQTRYDHNYTQGPPWQYNMIETFNLELPGTYTVGVYWEAADLQEISTVTAESETMGECAQQGVDLATVNEYPNFPNLDWRGQPYNANYGDLMSYQSSVYRALWWTTSIPGSDMSWEFVCAI